MNKIQISVTLNSDFFPGFYNTKLDYVENLENNYEGDLEIVEEMLNNPEYERDYVSQVCSLYAKLISDFGYNVISWELFKPSYYNYMNDLLEVTLDISIYDIFNKLSNSSYLEEIINRTISENEYEDEFLSELISNMISYEYLDLNNDDELFELINDILWNI